MRYALLVAALCGAVGCPSGNVGQNDVTGAKGVVAFTAETPLAFTTRLVVGSSFVPAFHAIESKDDALVAQGKLSSSNDKVIALQDGKLNVVGPGTADLVVTGKSGALDSITIHAGHAGATTLIDGALLAASSAVDARLPSKFSFTTDDVHTLQVAAVDKCGGDMIDLHASSIVGSGVVPSSITEAAPATFTVKTQTAGDVTLTLKTPGLDDLPYDVKSVDSGEVDQVKVSAVAVDDQNNVTLWGRAFANDVEVIGDLAFTWVSDPRVTIALPQGLIVSAAVSVPTQDQPPDTRPATATAEVFGELGTIDLLALGGTTAVTSRGPPARAVDTSSGGAASTGGAAYGSGCGGSGGCNPEAALLGLVGLRGLRGLRSLRRVRSLRGLTTTTGAHG